MPFEQTNAVIAHLNQRKQDLADYIIKSFLKLEGNTSSVAVSYFQQYVKWCDEPADKQSKSPFRFQHQTASPVKVDESFFKTVEEISQAYYQFVKQTNTAIIQIEQLCKQYIEHQCYQTYDSFSKYSVTLDTGITPVAAFLQPDSPFLPKQNNPNRLGWGVETWLATLSSRIFDVVIYYCGDTRQYRLFVNGQDWTQGHQNLPAVSLELNQIKIAQEEIGNLQSAIATYENLQKWVEQCGGEEALTEFIANSNQFLEKGLQKASYSSSNETFSKYIVEILFEISTNKSTNLLSSFFSPNSLELSEVKKNVLEKLDQCREEEGKISQGVQTILNSDLSGLHAEFLTGINSIKEWLTTYQEIKKRLEANQLTIAQLKLYSANLAIVAKEIKENATAQPRLLNAVKFFIENINQRYASGKNSLVNANAPLPKELCRTLPTQNLSSDQDDENHFWEKIVRPVRNEKEMRQDIEARKSKREYAKIFNALPALDSELLLPRKSRSKLGPVERYGVLVVALIIGALLEGIGLDFLFPGTATWMLFGGVIAILTVIIAMSAQNNSLKFTAAEEDLSPVNSVDYGAKQVIHPTPTTIPTNKPQATIEGISEIIAPLISDAGTQVTLKPNN